MVKAMSAVQDNLTEMQRLISAIEKGNNESNGEVSQITDDQSKGTKRSAAKASSGSVGEFLRQQKQRK